MPCPCLSTEQSRHHSYYPRGQSESRHPLFFLPVSLDRHCFLHIASRPLPLAGRFADREPRYSLMYVLWQKALVRIVQATMETLQRTDAKSDVSYHHGRQGQCADCGSEFLRIVGNFRFALPSSARYENAQCLKTETSEMRLDSKFGIHEAGTVCHYFLPCQRRRVVRGEALSKLIVAGCSQRSYKYNGVCMDAWPGRKHAPQFS